MMSIATVRNIPVLVTKMDLLVKQLIGIRCKVSLIWLLKPLKLERWCDNILLVWCYLWIKSEIKDGDIRSSIRVKSRSLVRHSPKQPNQISSKARLSDLFLQTRIWWECYAVLQNYLSHDTAPLHSITCGCLM